LRLVFKKIQSESTFFLNKIKPVRYFLNNTPASLDLDYKAIFPLVLV